MRIASAMAPTTTVGCRIGRHLLVQVDKAIEGSTKGVEEKEARWEDALSTLAKLGLACSWDGQPIRGQHLIYMAEYSHFSIIYVLI